MNYFRWSLGVLIAAVGLMFAQPVAKWHLHHRLEKLTCSQITLKQSFFNPFNGDLRLGGLKLVHVIDNAASEHGISQDPQEQSIELRADQVWTKCNLLALSTGQVVSPLAILDQCTLRVPRNIKNFIPDWKLSDGLMEASRNLSSSAGFVEIPFESRLFENSIEQLEAELDRTHQQLEDGLTGIQNQIETLQRRDYQSNNRLRNLHQARSAADDIQKVQNDLQLIEDIDLARLQELLDEANSKAELCVADLMALKSNSLGSWNNPMISRAVQQVTDKIFQSFASDLVNEASPFFGTTLSMLRLARLQPISSHTSLLGYGRTYNFSPSQSKAFEIDRLKLKGTLDAEGLQTHSMQGQIRRMSLDSAFQDDSPTKNKTFHNSSPTCEFCFNPNQNPDGIPLQTILTRGKWNSPENDFQLAYKQVKVGPTRWESESGPWRVMIESHNVDIGIYLEVQGNTVVCRFEVESNYNDKITLSPINHPTLISALPNRHNPRLTAEPIQLEISATPDSMKGMRLQGQVEGTFTDNGFVETHFDYESVWQNEINQSLEDEFLIDGKQRLNELVQMHVDQVEQRKKDFNHSIISAQTRLKSQLQKLNSELEREARLVDMVLSPHRNLRHAEQVPETRSVR